MSGSPGKSALRTIFRIAGKITYHFHWATIHLFNQPEFIAKSSIRKIHKELATTETEKKITLFYRKGNKVDSG